MFNGGRRAGHCTLKQVTWRANGAEGASRRDAGKAARTFLSARLGCAAAFLSLRGVGGRECPRSSALCFCAAHLPRLTWAALCAFLLCLIQLRALADNFFRLPQAQVLARENQGAVTLTVTRGSGSAADLGRSVAVSFTTVGGSALAGQDFTATSGTLVFGPGEETKSITVPIFDNSTLTDDRGFRVVLANPSEGAQLRWPYEANILILDNENPGSLDPSSRPRAVDPWSWAPISVLATQPDGKIIVGGSWFPNSVVARFHPDGSLDWTAPIGGNAATLAVTSDGHVLVGGQFTSVRGVARQNLAQLNPDGSLDTAFQADVTKGISPARVAAITVTRDQKIVVGGDFSSIGSTARAHLAQLRADGTVDPDSSAATFTVSSAALPIRALAVLNDGAVLAGGDFTRVNGFARQGLARFRADGSLDDTFAPTPDPATSLWSLAVQPDGMVLIGGAFLRVNGVQRPWLARLKPAGSLDGNFTVSNPPSASTGPIVVLPSGRILISGWMDTSHRGLVRLNSDGSADSGFLASFPWWSGANAQTVASLPDGKVVVGGQPIYGLPASPLGLARLNADTWVPAAGPAFGNSFSEPRAAPRGSATPRPRSRLRLIDPRQTTVLYSRLRL